MGRGIICSVLLFIFPATGFSQTDSFTSTGKASFYHDKFQGRETSNGEEYNQNDFTAAHRTLPFNTIVHVTNKQNNKNVIVRINDRGPFKKSRIIDLTRSAAMKLGMIPFGVVPVKIQPLTFLDRFPINDSSIGENEIRDCYAQKVELHDSAIFVWQTESIRHAFYMASDMLLNYHLQDVLVKATGTGAARKYKILIPCPATGEEARSLVKSFKSDGFLKAKVIHTGR